MIADFLLIPLALSIHMIFLFKRELLTDKRVAKWIWIGALGLFIAGYTLSPEYKHIIRTLPVLMMPIMTLSLYEVLLILYKAIFGKVPQDTFYTMDIRKLRSGLFNFIFWVVGSLVPAMLSMELVKDI